MSSSSFFLGQVAARGTADEREKEQAAADALFGRLFHAQQEFVRDPSRYKAALCPRRAGKSFAILVYALYVCLKRPRSRVLIISTTRGQARETYWSTLLELLEEHGIKARTRRQEISADFGNGSRLLFSGADTREEIKKIRGQKYDLAVIDEAASFASSLLLELIDDVLKFTLYDRLGQLVCIGTPGPVCDGYFWATTTEQASFQRRGNPHPTPLRVRRWANRAEWKGGYHWSLHKWTTKDNTACPWIWERALQQHVQDGVPDDDPTWLREGLGQWAADDDMLVMAFRSTAAERTLWKFDDEGAFGLPRGHRWKFMLGLDLGSVDATAFVVAAWSPTHPALHFVHTEKHTGWDIAQIAARAEELEATYGEFTVRVADKGALGKMITQHLSTVYSLHTIAAEKTDKPGYIRLMNADLRAGKVRLNHQSELADEWRTLVWKDNAKTVIDARCADDASDAALYLWRYAHHHCPRDLPSQHEEGTDEWFAAQEKLAKRQIIRKRKEEKGAWWKKFKRGLDRLPGSLKNRLPN